MDTDFQFPSAREMAWPISLAVFSISAFQKLASAGFPVHNRRHGKSEETNIQYLLL
jgi:hypothetical protein